MTKSLDEQETIKHSGVDVEVKAKGHKVVITMSTDEAVVAEVTLSPSSADGLAKKIWAACNRAIFYVGDDE